mmetsp:Transcript_12973/g.37676  ORF Transcript_12973/g.37676 Transcript_12973/m.37676 type:complete len:214 (-) Transcript_12973:310-951(-)
MQRLACPCYTSVSGPTIVESLSAPPSPPRPPPLRVDVSPIDRRVVERAAHDRLVVARVRADRVAGRQVPKPRRRVRRRSHKVRSVHTEHAVPHPAGVTDKRAVQLEVVVQVPELDSFVGAGGCELLAVGADKALEDVSRVRAQLVHRLKVRRQCRAAHHAPHVARAVRVGRDHHAAVHRDCQRSHGRADLGHQLATARVGRQVPYADVARLVA